MPTTEAMRESYSSYEGLHELAYWAVVEGAFIDDRVSLARDHGLGGFAYANANIPPGTRLLSIPRELAIDYAAATANLPTEIVRNQSLSREDTTHLFLGLEKLKGEDSFWQPYIKTLPERYGGPLCLEVDEAERWLKGTNLAGVCQRLERTYRETHGKIVAALRGVEGWEEQVRGFSFELYLWVVTMFSSRAFPDKLLQGPVEQETFGVQITEEENSTPALFPLLDLLNHRPRNKIRWNPNRYGLAFFNELPLSESQTIWNNYGPKTNEQLLLNYGFVLAHNPNDSVRLKMPQFLSGNKLQAWRKLVSENIDEGVYEFYVQDPSPPKCLLQYLQILFADEGELNGLNKVDSDMELWVSEKNELMSKAHLWYALVVKTKQHRDGANGMTSHNAIHRAIESYRAHQVRILTKIVNGLAQQITDIIKKPHVMTLEKLRNDDEFENLLCEMLGDEEQWDDDSPFVLGLCRKYMQYSNLMLQHQLGEDTWVTWFDKMSNRYPVQETPNIPGGWAEAFYNEYVTTGVAPGIFGSPRLSLNLLRWMEWVYGEESFMVPWGKPVSCVFF